jgi:hypothetical protein
MVERIRWGVKLLCVRATIQLSPRLSMRIQPPRNQCLVRSSERMNRTNSASENATARNLRLAADCWHGKDADCGSKDDRQSGKVCPERKLAVAVFSQAASDLRKFRHARRGAGYSLYADARNWIASNDRKWPYSFLNLCDALHLAADAIRTELLGNTSGHPSLKSRTT